MKSFKPSTGKKLAAFSFFMCMVVIGGMAVYYQYMKRQQLKSTTQTPTTEVQKLIDKDLDQGYPETPVEVMKLWGRYNQCLYNSKMTDEQREELVKKLRYMYSEELAQKNPEKEHVQKFQAEVDLFKNKKQRIVSYTTDNGTSVQYKNVGDKQCVQVRLSYFINNDGSYTKSYQDFILAKEDDRWKVMGFRAVKNTESTKEEAEKNSEKK